MTEANFIESQPLKKKKKKEAQKSMLNELCHKVKVVSNGFIDFHWQACDKVKVIV